MRIFKKTAFITLLLLAPSASIAQSQYCQIDHNVSSLILNEVRKKNPEAIRGLNNCFKFDHNLMLKAAIIDPDQFQFAADTLQSDENFVKRLIKVSPQALKYSSPKLRSNADFMERATYISRESLQFAAPVLTDNKLFMRRMIKKDPNNYKFASDRLKELTEFAEVAFEDDGMLLEFAPQKIKSDKNLVKIATNSNRHAIKFASDELQKDKKFKFKAEAISQINKPELEKFLQDNYTIREKEYNLGFLVIGKAKEFNENQIINRNYITKWQGDLRFSNRINNDDLHLIAADSRNYQILWQEDFSEYPNLIKKIENFLSNRNVDKNAISSLLTTSLWKIKDDPKTIAFNLYLLRDSNDIDLGLEFADVTSLTAIAQKHGNKWEITVIDVIFDREVKTDVGYENGHKKYILWDLYKIDEKDQSPKLIFKVEDFFREYFEIYEEQIGGKYKMIHQFEPSYMP